MSEFTFWNSLTQQMIDKSRLPENSGPAPAPAPVQSMDPNAPGNQFSMVGGEPGRVGGNMTTAPSTPTGGLQAFYDANKGDKTAMQKYLTDNGYTNATAASELGIDVGYVNNYFGGNPSPSNGSTTSGFNLSTMSGAPTFGDTPQAGPAPWVVDGNQTVASQLEKILKTDSPLMQLARTRAQQDAESRGLRNSTMAATAGEAAMIDRAMPIAQQDAQTFGNAGQFNADSRNTFTLADNQFNRDKSMAGFNLAANEWAAERSFGRGETAADRAYLRDNQSAELNFSRQDRMARINAELNRDANATGDAATLQRGYTNAINQARTDYATALANISSSSTMDAGLKTQTLQNLRTTYNTMIGNYARLLGWDANSWLIGDEEGTPTGVSAPPAVTNAPVYEGSF